MLPDTAEYAHPTQRIAHLDSAVQVTGLDATKQPIVVHKYKTLNSTKCQSLCACQPWLKENGVLSSMHPQTHSNTITAAY